MKPKTIKEMIISENKIKDVLVELGMKDVFDRGEYFSCRMSDGDNKTSTIVYKNSLNVEAHTRNIEEKNGSSDIFSLISFVNKTYFSKSKKWVCEVCGFDYYQKEEEPTLAMKWLKEMAFIERDSIGEDELKDLLPLDEYVLSYYGTYTNQLFLKDGIGYSTQKAFGLGYDLQSHRVTVPIRDEHGTLIGVKGRLYKKDLIKEEMKYIYVHRCAKSRVLFGLNMTEKYIKKEGLVYVFESEKAVMQMWDVGIKNCVAIGSHKISKYQARLLSHLGVAVVFCYDQGIGVKKQRDEEGREFIEYDSKGNYIIDYNFWKIQFQHFISGQEVGILWDSNKILDEGESPSDSIEKWESLSNNIRRTKVT